ncbi:hypothetical protein [Actinotalea sp.]|uniref:Ig-like domain repeat protein n=1 Tax=Actinotalea sp. TaxID=1872145 RepID=UPI002D1A7992|nr:hypothetical protein [Actinotalea sp.]HQY32728.1 hypothetical protein [Actinotalea sp.]HRA50288.1 hypothetical protein [Actinotalea sp.]
MRSPPTWSAGLAGIRLAGAALALPAAPAAAAVPGPGAFPMAPLASATSLVASTATVELGAPVLLTATVDPPDAAGAVEFFDGAVFLGTEPVTDGTAVLGTSALGAGPKPSRPSPRAGTC